LGRPILAESALVHGRLRACGVLVSVWYLNVRRESKLIEGGAWIDGGAPKRSSVLPCGVETIEQPDIDYRQGTIEGSLVDEAVSKFVTFVCSRP